MKQEVVVGTGTLVSIYVLFEYDDIVGFMYSLEVLKYFYNYKPCQHANSRVGSQKSEMHLCQCRLLRIVFICKCNLSISTHKQNVLL